MVLLGIGQGGTLSPLTVAGVVGVAGEDAGAASGLVNVAHQLGDSLGLGILDLVAAATGGAGIPDPGSLRVATALTAGTAMLALVVVMALIVRPE